MNRLRVLSVSTLFPNPANPAFGKFVASQMREVANRDDIDLTMISPIGLPPWPLSGRGPYRARRAVPAVVDFAGIQVHHPRFMLIPRIGGDGNPARIVRALLPFARRLHTAKPFDLVDAQFFFPDGPAAAAIARALGLPLTIKARGSDIHYWGTRPGALAQMRAAGAQAVGLLAVSQALRGDIAALGLPEERIRVHYTGLDRERFKVAARGAARALVSELPGGLDEGIAGPLIVTPGALIAIKGQRLAIASLVHLPGVHLAIAGTGEDEADLRALARQCNVADRVHFLGQVTHDIMPHLLAAADAVVLPSEREGLANVWIEALACGTPIVIPNIGGAREVVQGDSAGRIAARDPAAIAAAVADILVQPPPQAAVAAHAERYSWERNAAELAAFWREMAGRT